MPVSPPVADDTTPTWFVDSDDPAVRAFAEETTAGAADDRARAIQLFVAVRDLIRYDPYGLDVRPEAMRASAVLTSGRNWCVPKALLLAACLRAVGIPARLGFADVRNHLSTPRLLEAMGTDLFMWHGYTAVWLDGAWRKVTPAFNAELCERFGVPPLEFDGVHDALLHPFDGRGEQYMEYVEDRGTFADLPLIRILADFSSSYPAGLVERFATGTTDHPDPAFRWDVTSPVPGSG